MAIMSLDLFSAITLLSWPQLVYYAGLRPVVMYTPEAYLLQQLDCPVA